MGTHRPRKRVSGSVPKKTAPAERHPRKGVCLARADRPVLTEPPLYGLLDAADRKELERRRAKFTRAA